MVTSYANTRKLDLCCKLFTTRGVKQVHKVVVRVTLWLCHSSVVDPASSSHFRL